MTKGLHPQSPFVAAGLGQGDVVLSLGGTPINTQQEFLYRLSVLSNGPQSVTYLHDGATIETVVAMAPAPDEPDREEMTVIEDVILRGATLVRINPAVNSELHLPLDAKGVAVVAASDYALNIGLQAGDIVVAINGTPISAPSDDQPAAREASRRWQIDLIRQGQPLRLRFRL